MFYHPATARELLISDTWMDAYAVDNALRNYGRGGHEPEGTHFTVNSRSGNNGSHYDCYPVPGGWNIYHFTGTIKYELSDAGDLVSFFPGAFETISLGVK